MFHFDAVPYNVFHGDLTREKRVCNTLSTAMTTSALPVEASLEAQRHPHWALVIRVCNSQCFHSSARLKEFLIYVADCALRNCADEATEQHIGIHVFQRAAGYNSSEDSIVRTHARLLRQKLAEYFNSEGADEAVIIEIPKGHYLPIFGPRHLEATQTSNAVNASAADLTLAPEAPGIRKAHTLRHPWLLALVAAFAILVIGGFVRYETLPNPVDRFWAPFLADNAALVIYSNAVFTGDSKNGLKYAPPSDPQGTTLPDNYVDTYTGIGELASVYNLTQLFDRHHSHFILKRSMLVTWDEAKLNNLIFIGSAAENPSLRVLPSTRDFTMIAGDTYAGIVNHNPKPGELALYQRPEHPMTKDYAILALMPGLQPGKKILVFSGLTTLGTEAAVEFACHRDTAQQLLAGAAGPNGEIRPFEAVLETAIGGGVPLETHLIAIHAH
jgi:hypothetical protein